MLGRRKRGAGVAIGDSEDLPAGEDGWDETKVIGRADENEGPPDWREAENDDPFA